MAGIYGQSSQRPTSAWEIREDFVPNPFMTPTEFSHAGVLAAPVIEVISVTIEDYSGHMFKGDKPCQVHGYIKVWNEEGNDFYLYNRSVDEPETVYNGGALSLKIPNNGIILPSKTVCMSVNLLNIENRHVSHGMLEFHDLIDHACGDVVCDRVTGDLGCAIVRWVLYRYAITANVELSLLRKSDVGAKRAANIYGSITAHCVKPVEAEDLSVKLFGKSADESLNVKTETPIELARPQVAVPAYCSFRLDVELRSAEGYILSGTQEFFPYHSGFASMDVDGPDYIVKLVIEWGYPRQRLYQEMNSPSYPLFRMPMFSSAPTRAPPTLEVYSINVHQFEMDRHSACLAIYGDVGVDDYESDSSPHLLFLKKGDCKLVKSPHFRIPYLRAPGRRISNYQMAVNVSLKNEHDRSISRGCLTWDSVACQDFNRWFNKPLSSVIRGDHGYAVVNHTLLSDSVSLKLKVLNLGSCSVVHVDLIVFSAPFEYRSLSEVREFTDIIKLDSVKSYPMGLPSGCELLLSKDEIFVQRNAHVRISLDMGVEKYSPLIGPTVMEFIVDGGSRSFEGILEEPTVTVHKEPARDTTDPFKVKVIATWDW